MDRRLGHLVVLCVLVLGCTRGDRARPADDAASTSSTASMSTTTVADEGSPRPAVTSGTSSASIDVDGTSRTYRLHVPDGLGDNDVPLLIALHGGGGSGEQFASASRWDDVADREGFVVVYPDGTGGIPTWNAGLCCGAAARDDVDDVALVEALIDSLAATLPIDTGRVVLTGHSNGSTMAYRVACELADRIVAIGVQSAPLTFDGCSPTAAVSLLHVHGALDQNVPLGGGVGTRGISGVDWPPTIDGVELMASAAGCDTVPETTSSDGVATTVWTGCDGTTEVELVVVAEGGHGWMRPGGSGRLGDADDVGSFDTTETIWAFLSRQLG